MATSGYIRKEAAFGYVQLEWSVKSQDLVNATSTISYKLYVQRNTGEFSSSDARKYSIVIDGVTVKSGTVSLLGYGTKTVYSGTRTINHNSNGSKTFALSFSQEIGLGYGTITGSGTGELPTIDRKSALTISGDKLGATQILTISRKSTEFTHTIKYTCGTVTDNILLFYEDDGDDTISFIPPLILANQNTTGTQVTITYELRTYKGNEYCGSNTYSMPLKIPDSVAPTCSVTVVDDTGLADKFGKFIKGHSKAKVAVTITQAYNSGIASYRVAVGNVIYTEQNFTSGIITESGSFLVDVKITDKRGRTGTCFDIVPVYDYATPQITSLKVHRCKNDGTEDINGDHAKVTFSSKLTSLLSPNNTEQNTAKYVLQYKKSSEDDYTSIEFTEQRNVLSVSNASYIFAADTGSTYDVRIIATDELNSIPRATKISTGEVLMHWHSSGKAMGIGKIAEEEGVLDIGFKTRFFGGIKAMILEDGTNLNDVLTPNKYVGINSEGSGTCQNCPINGPFLLDVEDIGPMGYQFKQTISSCSPTASITYERISLYNNTDWGEWICTSDYGGHLLWEGESLMGADSVITLAEAVSRQCSGIALVFSKTQGYDPYSTGNDWQTHFVPKYLIKDVPGHTHTFSLFDDEMDYVGIKRLDIENDSISGYSGNTQSKTGESGITYDNGAWVLRYVIGI